MPACAPHVSSSNHQQAQTSTPFLTQVIKTPPTSYFIKKAAGVDSGSKRPGHEVAGQISLKHVLEIALVKQKDRPQIPLKSICKSVIGTAKAMGIAVVARPEDA